MDCRSGVQPSLLGQGRPYTRESGGNRAQNSREISRMYNNSRKSPIIKSDFDRISTVKTMGAPNFLKLNYRTKFPCKNNHNTDPCLPGRGWSACQGHCVVFPGKTFCLHYILLGYPKPKGGTTTLIRSTRSPSLFFSRFLGVFCGCISLVPLVSVLVSSVGISGIVAWDISGTVALMS